MESESKLPEDDDLIKVFRSFLEEIKGQKEKDFCNSMEKMINKISNWTNEQREAGFINLQGLKKILKTRNEELITQIQQVEWTIAFYQKIVAEQEQDKKKRINLFSRALSLFGKRFKKFFEGNAPAEIVAPSVSYSIEQFVKEENEKLQDEVERLEKVARRGRRTARFAFLIVVAFVVYFFRFYKDAKEAQAQAVKSSSEATKARVAVVDLKQKMVLVIDSVSNAWKIQLDAKFNSIASKKKAPPKKLKRRR
ncbi:MAG TPA: hypothetical protein VIH31_00525 [Candidatus Paceibacterota bacterium]